MCATTQKEYKLAQTNQPCVASSPPLQCHAAKTTTAAPGVVGNELKVSKGDIFTVPTIAELAGSLGSIGALGEAKA